MKRNKTLILRIVLNPHVTNDNMGGRYNEITKTNKGEPKETEK
jgi:hypothetical protein